MTYYALAALVNGLTSTVLGAFVLWKGIKKSLNVRYAVFCLFVSIWSYSYFLWQLTENDESALFWCRLLMAGAIFIPVSYLHYLYNLLAKQRSSVITIGYALGGILLLLDATDYFIRGVSPKMVFPSWPNAGAVYIFFLAYFFYYVILGLSALCNGYKGSSGASRNQIRYVLLASIIGWIGGATNYFLWYDIHILPIGNILVSVYVLLTAYAIVQLRLMDITIVIKRTTVYALLTTSITVGYVGIVLFTNWLMGGIMSLQALMIAMIPALLIAFAFAPLKEGIQVFIDRTLFKKRYDHRKILSDLSKVLTSIFSLEELLSLLLRMIREAMGIESGAIYLPTHSGGTYVAMAYQGNNNPRGSCENIAVDDPLIRNLSWRRELIIREEIERITALPEARSISGILGRMKADIGIPIFSKDTLTGILFLGGKETGETFTNEDIEMFNTLSHHIAVAIENAQLYTKVEESKIYQEILLNNLTSGVVAIDLNGRITAFNTRAEKMLGLKAERAIGADLNLLAPELRDILRDTLEQKVSVSAEEVTLKADTGKDLPFAVSSSIFNSYDGKTLGALIVFSDLTERKILETEMRRSDRLASLGTLAAGVAHEIKNPLVALKTFTQLLPEKYRDREFRENFSRLANQEVDRINYLVEQLLDFARPTVPSFRRTDICEILENTLFLLQSKITEQNIEVKKKIEQCPLMLMADGDQLKQVLLNVIINALQAIEEKGTLAVAARVRKATEAGTGATRGKGLARRLHRLWSQDCVVIEISDTGKGINPKDLPHLFDPFFTTKESGAGLGLAIAHSIIKEHGGIIDVRSEVGEGTTFSITLPMLPNESAVSIK